MPEPIRWVMYLMIVVICFLVALWALRQVGIVL